MRFASFWRSWGSRRAATDRRLGSLPRSWDAAPTSIRSAVPFSAIRTFTPPSLWTRTRRGRGAPGGCVPVRAREAVGIQPHDANGNPTRTVQLRAPLDFVALSDHAEFFRTVYGCSRRAPPSTTAPIARCSARCRTKASLLNFLVAYPPETRAIPPCAGTMERSAAIRPSCGARSKKTAEEAYDRDDTCRFTSFVAYEWSGAPDTANWHRNVIFRNEHVLERPISASTSHGPRSSGEG